MKQIKFDLPINGTKVHNLEELRDNFTTEILEHHASGMLLKWLKCRNLTVEANKLATITADFNNRQVLYDLCEVFGMDADRATWFKNSRLFVSCAIYHSESTENNSPDDNVKGKFTWGKQF